ncbi:MAG: hypothetical protein SVQ76_01795 [Candidatus Nanohaloarchaea archaeon]|nr:hypothetical protein [Candidatus Nanohaloarchaea archaeon]
MTEAAENTPEFWVSDEWEQLVDKGDPVEYEAMTVLKAYDRGFNYSNGRFDGVSRDELVGEMRDQLETFYGNWVVVDGYGGEEGGGEVREAMASVLAEQSMEAILSGDLEVDGRISYSPPRS